MMRKLFLYAAVVLSVLCIPAEPVLFSGSAYGYEKMIKTSYKKYKVFRLEDAAVICEPYTVKKDDWLYKIFRKKGMISEESFPLFLDLFSRINPDINNIDKIEPGEHIMIPLKKIKKNEYRETGHGIVKVPVLEYDKVPGAVKEYVSAHTVEAGESVSELIDKTFLQEDGSLTEQGMKAFKMANPGIKNIHMIYKGSTVYLPDPAIRSEPWFQQFFKSREKSEQKDRKPKKPAAKNESASWKKRPEKLDPYKLAQLRRYASLIEGTLLSKGEYRFPSKEGAGDRLDLSSTPLITLKNGSRILLLPDDGGNRAMIKRMRRHWNHLKVRKLSEILERENGADSVTKKIPETNEAFIERLLSFTDYDVQMDADISFSYNSVEIDVTMARVARENGPDLLIDFGNMYGNAFDMLKARGYKVLSVKPGNTKLEAASALFTALDLSVTQDPTFEKNKRLVRAEGLYVPGTNPDLFVAASDPGEDIKEFIKNRDIQIIHLSSSNKDMEAK